MEYIVLILVGLLGGLFAGTFGLGGGLIYIPTIIFLNPDVPDIYYFAVATSLSCIIFTGFSSAFFHYRKKNYEPEILKKVAPFVALGTFITTFILLKIPSLYLQWFYGIFVCFIGVKMFFHIKNKSNENTEKKQLQKLSSMPLIGALIGFLSTLLGVGGGSISVPIFTLYNKACIKKAIGTSSIVGVIIAVPATIGFILNSDGFETTHENFYHFFYVPAIILLLGSIVSAPFGVNVCHNLNQSLLEKLFGLLLLFIGIKVLF
ncbi:MAG: sulfite exporter TauE/SafE family protein [Nitrospinae bacterium]|nr:sulfite exporter TauE/SafE family protein [Nitrospinota bacterium]